MGFLTLNNAIKLAVFILLLLGIYYMINIGNRFVVRDSEIKLTKFNVKRILIVALALAIFYLLWTNFPVIGSVLTILIASIVFSYLISPLVNIFEKKLKTRNIKTAWSVIIVYAIIAGVIILLLGIVIPAISKEFSKFFNYIPRLIHVINEFADDLVARFSGGNGLFVGINIELILEEIETIAFKIFSSIRANLMDFIASLPDRIPNLISIVVIIAVVPIVSFYLLNDRKAILRKIKLFLIKNKQRRLLNLARDLNIAMSDYVRGRLLMCLFAGAATSVVMFVLRVDFAVVVGIITGIADIIPYVGPLIGFIPAVILAAMDSPIKAIIIALAYVLIQWLENNVVGPVILSDKVGLHPVIILFCIFIGGSIGGLLGMIFLTPIVVALKVIVVHFMPEIKTFVNKLLNR